MERESLKFLYCFLFQSLFLQNDTYVVMRIEYIRIVGQHLAVLLDSLIKFVLGAKSIGKEELRR